MNRRLYFLAPDAEHAQGIVEDLESAGISHEDIHAVSRSTELLRDLPAATHAQEQDRGLYLECGLWNLNLAVFAISIALLAVLLIKGLTGWAIIPLAIAISTFVVGLLFTRVPNAHLNEFRDALHHGEILLMIDTPRDRVAEIEDLVHHRHPGAVVGGVGWSSKTLHV